MAPVWHHVASVSGVGIVDLDRVGAVGPFLTFVARGPRGARIAVDYRPAEFVYAGLDAVGFVVA